MDRTMCPGQDTRYWRPDDIFTVPCGSCGAEIEFFKDDAARRCAKCGTRVRNPRLSLGCARWCQHAKECLGYDPRESAEDGGGTARSVAEAIIAALKLEFGEGSPVVAQSTAAYDRARALLADGPADPAAVLPAVLLLLADGPGDGAARARRIMADAGVERIAAEDACALIAAYHGGADEVPAGVSVMRKAHAGSACAS